MLAVCRVVFSNLAPASVYTATLVRSNPNGLWADDKSDLRAVVGRVDPLPLRFKVSNCELQFVVVCPHTPSERLHAVTNRCGEFLEG